MRRIEQDPADCMQDLQFMVVQCNEMNPGERVRKILELERARMAYIRAYEKARDVIHYVEGELKIYE